MKKYDIVVEIFWSGNLVELTPVIVKSIETEREFYITNRNDP